MKTTLLPFLLLLLSVATLAQTPPIKGVVKGIIIDSAKNAPLGYATIALVDAATKAPVKSTLTKDNGTFELKDLEIKNYLLNVISVGYTSKTIGINTLSSTKPEADAGRIILAPSNAQLGEVKITAAKPLVKQEIDRMSYDVQADPESKAQTAMDMLRKVPLVTIDGDDNIQLQGSGSYRIFINGKPSALLTNNPKDVLRAMPATNIQKIEVITTPPAKYDAEGLAGIINIITSKKTDDGYNGTVTARYNFPWGPNINLSTTYKQGKFGLSGFLGTGRQVPTKFESGSYRETYSPASVFTQNGIFDNAGGGWGYGSVETSYEIDTLNLLTASLNYNFGDFRNSSNKLTQFSSQAPGILPQSYNLINIGGNGYTGTDVSFNYQLGFKRNKQQLLTTSYRYTDYNNGQHNDISSINDVNYNGPDYTQRNNAGEQAHTFQVDYIQPMKKLTLEAGAKAILRKNTSETEATVFSIRNGQGSFVEDPSRENDLIYHQDVYSLYNSYTYKLTKWVFKAGARLERTQVDANFVTNATTLNMGYTNIVPSLSAQLMLPKNQSLTFGYTNRLERPSIYQLNPFVDRSNPQIISTGNPNLRPVISDLIELTYSKSGTGSFSTKLSYMHTGGMAVSVIRLISDTLSETTYENVGNSKILRWNVNGNNPIGKKVNINYSTGLFYVWISGPYNGRFYSNHGLRTNTFVSGSYKPGDGWSFGLSYGFNRRYIMLQGSSNDYMYSSISAYKTFANKKLTITGVVNNPYKTYNQFTNYTSTPDFYQSNTSNNYYRNFSLSLSYKFGKLSSDIKKNQRTINNDDLSGK
ncbi:outer membrane beta-barrel family protein [Mucilaginibacter ginkgonis]|uniref:TonB-dependent receptor n=1 Tax=Mucilaginibacter ginkgonis TaxID=2682091 RepID=A0A6I4HZ94_9SPHI|nr:outer membrane beta-barrel family protein [Mucilaginibacter ginkgonis]QQL48670.1 TonB-dependent receptor [Mucilaginibacter ginkgonis]